MEERKFVGDSDDLAAMKVACFEAAGIEYKLVFTTDPVSGQFISVDAVPVKGSQQS